MLDIQSDYKFYIYVLCTYYQPYDYYKLDEYIYTYFLTIPVIPLNKFSYNKNCCSCHSKKQQTFIFFTFNQNQNFIKKISFIIFKR